ncbi:PPC domain-containing protein [Myxococcus qinghaiensis]|uniref:PPC domain-containing protein n=1 Tax=Myxococcus qinghaiensis TaxID=2906758 RepID=UPI0020A6E2B0|nr:pre-peptidase C-terminal domain-containing protein [Myxococcus qinghaiensis]MCP3169594.1 PPC domain-containing protein [Myxococcus qinghaiensis]
MNCLQRICLLAGALLLWSGCGDELPESGLDSTERREQGLVDGVLTPGTAVPFIAAPTGGQRLYTMDVPANQSAVTFTTTGGPGNLDMKVGFGAAPTATTGECTSAGADSVERCTVSGREAAGTWYVLLTATSAFSNVTLTGTVTPHGTGTSPVRTLTPGQAVTGVSGVVGDWLMYSLQVPAGQTQLSVALSEGTGDADLYLRRGSTPDLATYDCRSRNVGNSESCLVSAPLSGTWYVMVRGYKVFSGAKLVGTVVPPVTALINGQPVLSLSAAKDVNLFYKLEVPAQQTSLKVTLTGGTGDADLYVKREALPTTASYDCRSWVSGNAETCTVTAPAAGTYYVMVRAYAAFSGITLLAQTVGGAEQAIPLTNGLTVSGLYSDTGGPFLFKLEVPPAVATLRFEVPNVFAGSFFMSVKYGSPPVGTDYDCSQTSTGAGCSYEEPQAGTWYVRVAPHYPYNYFDYLSVLGVYRGVVSHTALTNLQPVTGVGGHGNDRLYYTLQVPPGQARLAIWAQGGAGSASVSARLGRKPEHDGGYVCRQGLPGSCVIDAPAAGTWHFWVEPSGNNNFEGHTLTAGYTSSVPVSTGELVLDQPSAPISGMPLEDRLFTLQVPPHQVKLEFSLSNPTLDVVVDARPGGVPPPTGLSGCLMGVTCVIERPAGGTWYVRVRARAAFSGQTLVAKVTAPTPLLNGITVNGIPEGFQPNYYRFDVPPGRNGLTFVTQGASQADASLYVKRGSLPTTTDYDCASTQSYSSYERCDYFDPQEGPWFVLVKVTSMWPPPGAGYNATLVARHSETGPISSITADTATPVLPSSNVFRTYRLELPEGRPYLLVELVDKPYHVGTGPEIWIQHQASPTEFSYKCKSRSACDIPTPAGGVWFITLYGSSAYDGMMRITTMNREARELVNGMWEQPVQNVPVSTMTVFKLEVPPGASHLNFNLKGETTNTSNANLFVRYGAPPTTYSHDCASRNAMGSEENCDFVQPRAGTWYVGHWTQTVTNIPSEARLSGTWSMTQAEGIPSLTSHVALTGLTAQPGSQQVWKLEVPPGQGLLWFGTGNGVGNPALKVKFGGRPVGSASVDCSGSTTSSGQVCVIPNPSEGTWFVSLTGPARYRGLSLMGGFINAGTVTALANGVPLPNLVIKPGHPQFFTLEVPAGETELLFEASAPATTTGDLAVYLAKDTLPTTASTRCAEPTAGTVRCQVSAPQAGTWYTLVRSSSATYDTARIVGFHARQVDTVPLVRSGTYTKGLTGSVSLARTFKVMVPPGADHLAVEAGPMDTGSPAGSVKIATRKGSPPTATEFGCASSGGGSYGACWVLDPEPGVWYVTMTPTTAYRDQWVFVEAP